MQTGLGASLGPRFWPGVASVVYFDVQPCFLDKPPPRAGSWPAAPHAAHTRGCLGSLQKASWIELQKARIGAHDPQVLGWGGVMTIPWQLVGQVDFLAQRPGHHLQHGQASSSPQLQPSSHCCSTVAGWDSQDIPTHCYNTPDPCLVFLPQNMYPSSTLCSYQ